MSKFINLALSPEAQATADPTANVDAVTAAGVAEADKLRLRAQQAGAAVVTPTEQVAERTPQAASLGTPENIARVQEQAPELTASATEDQYVPLSPEEATQRYQGQLKSELRPRGTVDVESGEIWIPADSLNLSKDKDVGVVNDMTMGVAKAEQAIVGKESALAPGRKSRKTGEVPAYYTAMGDIGLAQQGVNARGEPGQWEMRPGAGGALYLSTLIALSRLGGDQDVDKQAARVAEGKESETGGYDAEQLINEGSLVRMIGKELEQLTQPIEGTTGETNRFGFQYKLDDRQHAAIGNAALASFGQVGISQDETSPEFEDSNPLIIRRSMGDGTKRQYGYELTQAGYDFIQNASNILEDLAPDLKRPVSYTPLPAGKYVGEAAIGQKSVTRTPQAGVSRVTPVMKEAADVVGNMGNVVVPENFKMLSLLFSEVEAKQKEGGESSAADLFSQGAAYANKLLQKSKDQSVVKKYATYDKPSGKWVKTDMEGNTYELHQSYQDQFNAKHKNPEHGEEYVTQVTTLRRTQDQESHARYVRKVQTAGWEKAKRVLEQAAAAQDKVFYYGSTFIGNSSRMMVTQTELNWQANKMARLLVGNPRPTQVIKGGKADKAFKYVAARAVLDGADKFTPQALIKEFDRVYDRILPAAQAVYNATQAGDGAALAAAIELAKQIPELAHEWEPKGEWGFVLEGLHEIGKYDAAPKGGTIATRLKAEADGINNGSSIQGMQFGSKLILERAGVLFDPEGDTVIEENMRGYVFNRLGDALDDNVFSDPEKNDAARKLYNKITGGMVKSFIKKPLMTTIYGMPANAHGDSAAEFISEYADQILDDLSPEGKADAVKLATDMIEKALLYSLQEPLLHQDVVKHTAGWLYNIANVIPRIEGPNGYVFQAGDIEFFEDGELTTSTSYRKLTPTGEVTKTAKERELTTKKAVGTATAPKVDKHGTHIGKVTRNQLAVSGTHNIDATVAQKTLIRANKEIPNFWGQQVFDAFIGDVSSMEKLLDIANEEFISVNMTYNMYKAEKDSMQQVAQVLNKRAADAGPDAEWSVGPTGDYKGVYAFAKSMTTNRNKRRWGDKYPEMKNLMESLGFSYDEKSGALVTYPEKLPPKQVVRFYEFAQANFLTPPRELERKSDIVGKPIMAALNEGIRETERDRAEIMRLIKAQQHGGRQYN